MNILPGLYTFREKGTAGMFLAFQRLMQIQGEGYCGPTRGWEG